MTQDTLTILLVEDDPGEAGLVQIGLRSSLNRPYTLTHVETLGAAQQALHSQPFDVCLLDLSLPDSHGMTTVKTLSGAFPDLPIVVLTGNDSEELEDEAIRHGGQDYLVKGDAAPRAIARAIRHATERARLHIRLRQSHERFRDFAEVSADWFWETDAALRFTWFSDRLQAVTGVSPADLIGKRREDFAEVEDTEAWRAYHQAVTDRRPIQAFDYALNTPTGRRWFRVNGKPLFENGVFCGYRGTGTDITLQREQADKLVEAKQRAEEATAAKSRFLSSMSHEIRTPITGVLGMAQLLRETPLVAPQQDYVDNILEAGETLLALINDLLDLAKVEAGRLEIAPADCSLRAEVDGVVRLLRHRAEEKGLALAVEWRAGAVDAVHLDPVRLRQILLNLLGNAIKFTAQGRVGVVVETLMQGDRSGLKITVEDTGIGLSPQACQSLFQDFVQATATTAHHYGGTGLGLSISRRLVEAMGGSIAVDSTEGVGSRFSFWLPLVQATAPFPAAPPKSAADTPAPTPLAPTAPARSLSILLAEDNRINRLLLTTILASHGHRVETAENGRIAVEKLAAATTAYDVVLMDVMMPDMDGIEATRTIRATPALAALPIIGVTADAMTDRVAAFRNVGMNAVIAKPINQRELLETLIEVTAKGGPRQIRS